MVEESFADFVSEWFHFLKTRDRVVKAWPESKRGLWLILEGLVAWGLPPDPHFQTPWGSYETNLFFPLTISSFVICSATFCHLWTTSGSIWTLVTLCPRIRVFNRPKPISLLILKTFESNLSPRLHGIYCNPPKLGDWTSGYSQCLVTL